MGKKFLIVFIICYIQCAFNSLPLDHSVRSRQFKTRAQGASPISGNKRRNTSSTMFTIRCLLRYESANISRLPSTSFRMSATSFVAKNVARKCGGTTSTMTRAHSRLMATTSSSEGGTRAGPRASSGKMTRRMACRAGGSKAGFIARAVKVCESNLEN